MGVERTQPIRDVELTDGQLIVLSWQHPNEFVTIYKRHHATLNGYLRRRYSPELAQDLAADTFKIAFEQRDSYDREIADARPWLFGIATNLARRHYRKESRELRAIARLPSGIELNVDDELIARVDANAVKRSLAKALRKLPQADRDTLLLLAWAELTYDEIAEALDVPIGTVRSRIARARKRLRSELTEHSIDVFTL